MRQLTTILLTAGVSGTALGHELPGTESQLRQLIHHGLSLHHAPAILLVVILGLLAYRALRRLSE
jgi:hypothetical protein